MEKFTIGGLDFRQAERHLMHSISNSANNYNYMKILYDSIYINIIIISLNQSLHTLTHDPKILEYKGPLSIDYRERGSHARGVYLTQYTSRMGTARVKEEVGADTRIMRK